jgi:hypothetical protein
VSVYFIVGGDSIGVTVLSKELSQINLPNNNCQLIFYMNILVVMAEYIAKGDHRFHNLL